jgi:predicted nucleic acid-binding Zn ribbon protein
MKRLDQAATNALRTLLEGQPTTEGKVAFAWSVAAGPALARAATVRWSENGTLHVVARSETWRQELARAKPVIAQRIGHLVGPGVVRRIAIEIAPDPRLATNLTSRPRG